MHEIIAGGLSVTAIDEPGPGGASHRFNITGYDAENNPRRFDGNGHKIGDTKLTQILFQCGPVGAQGRNGVTEEALLAIVDDRLRSFQAGPYPCAENELALAHVERALEELQNRTARRRATGIEGLNVEQELQGIEPAPTSAEIIADLSASNARLLDVMASIRDRLNIDEGESILDAMDERAKLIAELRSFHQAVLDPENQPSQFGTMLLIGAEKDDEKAFDGIEGEQPGDVIDEQHKTDPLGDSTGGKPYGELMNNPVVNLGGQHSEVPGPVEPPAADDATEQDLINAQIDEPRREEDEALVPKHTAKRAPKKTKALAQS